MSTVNPFTDISATELHNVVSILDRVIRLCELGFSYDSAEDAVFQTAQRMLSPDTESDTTVIQSLNLPNVKTVPELVSFIDSLDVPLIHDCHDY